MRALAAFLLLVVAACASASPPAPQAGARRTIDIAAEQWVRLALEIDTHEEGFVDAYYGPDAWREQARANPRAIADLRRNADHITEMLTNVATLDTSEESRRRAQLMLASVASARFRLDMIEGQRVPFAEEAERLFALRPELRPLSDYDPILARLETTVPGEGPLSERIIAFTSRYAIRVGRVEAVMQAAIAECRRRTRAHFDLPADEAFTMEFVTGQSWSAYNWYQGQNRSLIQINMDRPPSPEGAVGLACHEGYPGHHVQGIYAERLYRTHGWVEYSVAPLYSPSGPLAEGAGNYGVELAFPGDEQLAFVRDVLYPLAGLDPATARAHHDLREALDGMRGARLTIAQMYLDGEIDRARALTLIMRYQFSSQAGAEQTLRFIDHYRSYVINYVSGEEIVRAYVERASASPEARWAAFERIMAQPMLPRELMQ